MKQYKFDVKFTIELLVFAMVYLGLSYVKSPILTYIVFGFYILYSFFDLYSNIKYTSTKSTYIFYSGRKSKFSKIVSVILGGLIFITTLSYVIWTGSFPTAALLGFVSGSWIITNGVFESPVNHE